MAKKKKSQAERDPEVAIEAALGKTEDFLERNSGNLLVALAVIVLIAGGYFGYKYLYAHPRAHKAADMMFVAQQQFAIDSFALALNGDGNNAGFLDVIDRFGRTPQGNLANHYAGICYLRLGDRQQATHYLGRYRTTSGVPNRIVNAQNWGLQGDIMVQDGNLKEASNLFKKAVEAADNVLTTPYYLKKSGLVYEELGDFKAASAAYRRIETDYPASMEARDIAKYIGRVEQR